MLAGSDIRAALHELMRRGADAKLSEPEFNSLALRVFAHQFEHNAPYRRYCERRGRTPADTTRWTDMPAVPTGAFKEVALVAGNPKNAQLVFKTSGTTRGAEKRGIHYILDPSLYEASLLATFRTFVLRGAPPLRMISLIPPHADAPDSSLSYMASVIVRELGARDSDFFASVSGGLDTGRLNAALAPAREPVCLLGTSLAYAHWLDSLADLRFELPAGSRLMDTGGFKGEMRSVSADELRARYASVLGIATEDCINEYGMTELCSQYYDLPRMDRPRAGPPWLRPRVVDPENLLPLPYGATGILQHFDFANLDSVAAVQTEDLAYESENGFVLLGRAPGATPRGCSIAMDILLSDAQR
ncbi:MAG: LuxE/PaaK family acyltransferase [Gemmatimonadota bacterium]